MMICRKKVLFLIASLSVFLLFACPTAAPLQQREASKTSLERAKSVMAAVFAKEKYSVAVQNFETGESLIDKEKKTKDNAKALKNYEIAKQNADLAHAQAVGPYAQSLLEEAQVQINLSKEEGFIENNIEHFPDAVKKFEEAKVSLEEKIYDDFFVTIKDFDKNMTLARDLFTALVTRLEEVKAREKAIDQEVVKRKGLNAAPEEYKKAFASKDGAFAAMREKNYEKAISFLLDSITQLEKVLVVIEKKRLLAGEELKRAEKVLSSVKGRVQEHSQQSKISAKKKVDTKKIDMKSVDTKNVDTNESKSKK